MDLGSVERPPHDRVAPVAEHDHPVVGEAPFEARRERLERSRAEEVADLAQHDEVDVLLGEPLGQLGVQDLDVVEVP